LQPRLGNAKEWTFMDEFELKPSIYSRNHQIPSQPNIPFEQNFGIPHEQVSEVIRGKHRENYH